MCAPEPPRAATGPGLAVTSLDECGLALPSDSSRVCVSWGHSFRAWLPLHVSMKLILCLLFTESPGVDFRSRRGCWRLYCWLHCSELPLTPTPFSPTEQVLVLGLNRMSKRPAPGHQPPWLTVWTPGPLLVSHRNVSVTERL